MRFLGMITAPWCQAVRSSSLVPRVLADDLAALSAGSQHLYSTLHAAFATARYARQAGGKIKPHKTWAFASTEEDRRALCLSPSASISVNEEMRPYLREHREKLRRCG